jgi:hypothetical protein
MRGGSLGGFHRPSHGPLIFIDCFVPLGHEFSSCSVHPVILGIGLVNLVYPFSQIEVLLKSESLELGIVVLQSYSSATLTDVVL